MQLNGVFTARNPAGSGDVDAVLDMFAVLRGFMESFDYAAMKRDFSFIADGVPTGAPSWSVVVAPRPVKPCNWKLRRGSDEWLPVSSIEVASGAALLWRLHHDMNPSRREQVERTTLQIVGWCFIALAVHPVRIHLHTVRPNPGKEHSRNLDRCRLRGGHADLAEPSGGLLPGSEAGHEGRFPSDRLLHVSVNDSVGRLAFECRCEMVVGRSGCGAGNGPGERRVVMSAGTRDELRHDLPECGTGQDHQWASVRHDVGPWSGRVDLGGWKAGQREHGPQALPGRPGRPQESRPGGPVRRS